MKQKPSKRLQHFPIAQILLPTHVGLMFEDIKLIALRDGVGLPNLPLVHQVSEYFLMDINRGIV